MRGSSQESFKLDKPHSELMRYDVHPNALTQSGNYHFSGKKHSVLINYIQCYVMLSGNLEIQI